MRIWKTPPAEPPNAPIPDKRQPVIDAGNAYCEKVEFLRQNTLLEEEERKALMNRAKETFIQVIEEYVAS